MASSKQVLALLLAILAAVLPFSTAADIVVGDDDGWKPDFNYTSWAEGKEFRVGDNLVFRYKAGAHNVIPVGGEEFRACRASAGAAEFNSGDDVIPLKTVGRKWYMCGVGDHCQRGQKLLITVLPSSSPPPPPPPSSSANGVRIHAYLLFMAAAAAMNIMN